jgi:hypothetical protein
MLHLKQSSDNRAFMHTLQQAIQYNKSYSLHSSISMVATGKWEIPGR